MTSFLRSTKSTSFCTPKVGLKRCLVCNKEVRCGEYFSTPNHMDDLQRWGLGLFPTDSQKQELFIEHVRVGHPEMTVLCCRHFTSDALRGMREGSYVPSNAVPVEYHGNFTPFHSSFQLYQTKELAKGKEPHKKKCVVCLSVLPASQMYPFPVRDPVLREWCETLRGSIPEAEQMRKSILRCSQPVLCRDHFPQECFTYNGLLLPGSLPTKNTSYPTKSIMSILEHASRELNSIFPGTSIPSDSEWTKKEKLFDKEMEEKKRKWREMNQLRAESCDLKNDPLLYDPIQNEVELDETPLPLFYEPTSKKEDVAVMDEDMDNFMLYESPSTSIPISSPVPLPIVPPAPTPTPVVEPVVVEKRGRPEKGKKRGKYRKKEMPMVNTVTRSDAKMMLEWCQNDARSRHVKRPHLDADVTTQPEPIAPIIAEPVAVPEATNIALHKDVPHADESKSTDNESTPVNAKKKRSKPLKLIVPTIVCEICHQEAEDSTYGMKEHAREHCVDSLKCPYEPCTFTAVTRNKISYHTQQFHQRWALAVDIGQLHSNIALMLEAAVRKSFPSTVARNERNNGISCEICTLIVEPQYRAMYSHACLHLPNRPYVCSECPTFESYNEEQMEEHLRKRICHGEVVSNMDYALSDLVERLFITAFPRYAHLVQTEDVYEREFMTVKLEETAVARMPRKREEESLLFDVLPEPTKPIVRAPHIPQRWRGTVFRPVKDPNAPDTSYIRNMLKWINHDHMFYQRRRCY